jgi:hypothetical protein
VSCVCISPHFIPIVLLQNCSCDADQKDLDNPAAEPRTSEKTENLLQTTSADDLWYQHGLIYDFYVCLTCFRDDVQLIHQPQPFTADFPRANIHELLTPDLLHQAIKGAFKDHLVDWVQGYLEAQHGPSESKRVLDEIDRRCGSCVRDFHYISF